MSTAAVPAGNGWLFAGGVLSATAALAHLACIAGGPDWYRFFGAGEAMAAGAARGDWRPAVLTTAIALVLAVWAAYAFAGAGAIRPLPLMKPALIGIAAVYMLRGLVLFRPTALGRPDLSPAFLLWSSAIVLAIGLVHVVGIVRGWRNL